jgi:hypothetical protein
MLAHHLKIGASGRMTCNDQAFLNKRRASAHPLWTYAARRQAQCCKRPPDKRQRLCIDQKTAPGKGTSA